MKFRTLHLLAILLAALLVSGPFVLAGKGTITVTCVDGSGNPIQKIQIFAQAIKEDKLAKEKTDKSGVATFSKLNDDLYRVWGHAEGFAPAFHEFVQLVNEGSKAVTLTFEAGDSNQKLYFEDQGVLDQANAALREGAQALRTGQYDEAEAKLKSALAINPSNPTVLHNLALVYVSKGDFDTALETLHQVSDLIDLFLTIDNSEGLKNQRNEIAAIIESIPLRRVAHQADQAMRAHKFDEAAVALREMLRLQPDNANAWYHLSVALTQVRKFEEAQQTVAKAIEFAPDNATFKDLQTRIGELIDAEAKRKEQTQVAEVQKLVDNKQYDEALAKIPALVESVSEEYHSALWTEAARAYLAQEKWDEAFEAYTKSKSLSGGQADEGIFKIGEDLIKKGKLAEARRAFEFTMKINPDFAEAYYELGMDAFYETGDKAKAKNYLTRYLEIGTDAAHKDNAHNVLIVMEKSK